MMSATPKAQRRPWEFAARAAQTIVDALGPACERIEVAGSIRRRRPDVGDVEIVLQPRMVDGARVDLFASAPKVPATDAALAAMAIAGQLVAHPTKPASGERYKRLFAPQAGLQVDLFLVRPPAEWGPIFAIRTGPADYSASAVTRLRERGLRCENGQIWQGGNVLDCPDEETFFRLAGVPFAAPEARGR